MNVIGLDLSLRSPGVAFDDKPRTLLRSKLDGGDLLKYWAKTFADLIDEVRPDLAVMESYAFGTNTIGHHAVVEMGGVVRLVLATKGVRYTTVTTQQMKKYATGKGGSPKGAKAYERKLPVIQAALANGVTLHSRTKRTGEVIYDDNAADAWWLYQMGLAHYAPDDERVRNVPAVNRSTLEKVSWPKLRKAQLAS